MYRIIFLFFLASASLNLTLFFFFFFGLPGERNLNVSFGPNMRPKSPAMLNLIRRGPVLSLYSTGRSKWSLVRNLTNCACSSFHHLCVITDLHLHVFLYNYLLFLHVIYRFCCPASSYLQIIYSIRKGVSVAVMKIILICSFHHLWVVSDLNSQLSFIVSKLRTCFLFCYGFCAVENQSHLN